MALSSPPPPLSDRLTKPIKQEDKMSSDGSPGNSSEEKSQEQMDRRRNSISEETVDLTSQQIKLETKQEETVEEHMEIVT